MTDPISDFLIRLKNASAVKKDNIFIPSSKIKLSIAELLHNKGYIESVVEKSKGKTKLLNIKLLYDKDGIPAISGVKRISKPSRRMYKNAKNINKFRKGFGMSVFSTPKGLRADMDARREKVGGEMLFNIW